MDELSTLLTSGRLSRAKRERLVSVYDDNGGGKIGLIRAQELMTSTPEFHANGLARTTNERRPQIDAPAPPVNPYKAVVQILLTGGYDSWNVLVPHTCQGESLQGETVDAQYRRIRSDLALTEREMESTTIQASGQPCGTFAIHPDMPFIKELYDEGSLAFLANVGIVDTIEMDKNNYDAVSVSTLFGHNTMQKETRLIDPYRKERGTGIFGRLSEVLTGKGFHTSGISIDNPSDATFTSGEAPDPLTISRRGFAEFYPRPASEESFDIQDHAEFLNAKADLYTNVFGESWSEKFLSGADRAKTMNEFLEATSLGQQWIRQSALSEQLSTVARLMQTQRQRGVDRDMFYMDSGFWDHVSLFFFFAHSF